MDPTLPRVDARFLLQQPHTDAGRCLAVDAAACWATSTSNTPALETRSARCPRSHGATGKARQDGALLRGTRTHLARHSLGATGRSIGGVGLRITFMHIATHRQTRLNGATLLRTLNQGHYDSSAPTQPAMQRVIRIYPMRHWSMGHGDEFPCRRAECQEAISRDKSLARVEGMTTTPLPETHPFTIGGKR